MLENYQLVMIIFTDTLIILNFGNYLYVTYNLQQFRNLCIPCELPVLSSFMTCHQVCKQINTMGVTSGAGFAYPSGAPEFTPWFLVGLCNSIFSFISMFCRSLFVSLYFFFWPLCCLSFDLRILITLLVSSNYSYLFIYLFFYLFIYLLSENYLFIYLFIY